MADPKENQDDIAVVEGQDGSATVDLPDPPFSLPQTITWAFFVALCIVYFYRRAEARTSL